MKSGADVKSVDRLYKQTPLHHACASGNKDIVPYLVEDIKCEVGEYMNVYIINSLHACAARVIVCLKGTLKCRHQRSVNDTLQCFDSWILLTMLGSRDMAKFVSQEAYDRSYTLLIIR